MAAAPAPRSRRQAAALGLVVLVVILLLAAGRVCAADDYPLLEPDGPPSTAPGNAGAVGASDDALASPADPAAVEAMFQGSGLPAPPPGVLSSDDATARAVADKAAAVRSARVAADKAAVGEALKDPAAAWARHKVAMAARITELRAAGARLPPALEIVANETTALLSPATAAPANGRTTLAASAELRRSEAKRERIFRKALANIARLNKASGPDLAYGVNQFTHLTEGEFRAAYTSKFPPRPPELDHPPDGGDESAGRRRALNQANDGQPQGAFTCTGSGRQAYKKYSWTKLTPPTTITWTGFTTPVKDQGSCGSCAAFAVTAAVESSFLKSYTSYSRNNLDLSEQVFMECFTGDQCDGFW